MINIFLKTVKNWWFGLKKLNNSKHPDTMVKLAEDIHKLSINQFKLGQQFEDFSEEILAMFQQEIRLADGYKKWIESKDNIINEIQAQNAAQIKRIENLVAALIDLTDMVGIIYNSIAALGDTNWLLQMERVNKAIHLLLSENGILELGHEEYFDESLHEAVATVHEEGKGLREITSIEQKGYIYLGRVVRKAKVVVNVQRKVGFENGQEK